MFSIEYDVSGGPEVQHELQGMEERLIDLRPVWTIIAEHMRLLESETFASEGHGSWAPLADSTVAYKARHGLRPEILRATDDLMSSLTEAGPGIDYMTPSEMIFGTSVPYAGFHKTGTKNMPARDPMMFDEFDMREWTREVQRYLMAL